MTTPLFRLPLLLLPLLASCGSEPPAREEPLTAEMEDRRELVRQPKSEWTPENAPRKLDIRFLTERSRIRKGEAFKYRLEMQNVGREPLMIEETAPSFLKDGSLCGAGVFQIHVTPPGGKERRLLCSPAEDAAVASSTAPAREAGSGLALSLKPGEYLLTRGGGTPTWFRELRSKTALSALGKHRLKAVYAPAGGFKAVSNTVDVEVVP
jgi:hypothetical protein